MILPDGTALSLRSAYTLVNLEIELDEPCCTCAYIVVDRMLSCSQLVRSAESSSYNGPQLTHSQGSSRPLSSTLSRPGSPDPRAPGQQISNASGVFGCAL